MKISSAFITPSGFFYTTFFYLSLGCIWVDNKLLRVQLRIIPTHMLKQPTSCVSHIDCILLIFSQSHISSFHQPSMPRKSYSSYSIFLLLHSTHWDWRAYRWYLKKDPLKNHHRCHRLILILSLLEKEVRQIYANDNGNAFWKWLAWKKYAINGKIP